MIILRQKSYAKKDYLDTDGKPLPLDLIKRVERKRGKIAGDLMKQRKNINKRYEGEKPKFLKFLSPNYKGDIKARNESYDFVLQGAKDEASRVTKDARAISYFRKKNILGQ